MKKKQIEAYQFFKKRYPDSLLFFHVENQYVALLEDANLIAISKNIKGDTEEIHYPDSDISFLSDILGDGLKFKIIERRNEEGVFDYPDIQEILQEEKLDY